jgi:hypothetical protein
VALYRESDKEQTLALLIEGHESRGRRSGWSGCTSPRRVSEHSLIVSVKEDITEKVDVDSSRSVTIPDNSIPIVEDGKIVAHRVEAQLMKTGKCQSVMLQTSSR